MNSVRACTLRGQFDLVTSPQPIDIEEVCIQLKISNSIRCNELNDSVIKFVVKFGFIYIFFYFAYSVACHIFYVFPVLSPEL